MEQSFQEWTKQNFWKIVFKNFDAIWLASADHFTSTNFTWSILEYFVPNVALWRALTIPCDVTLKTL